MNILRNPAVRRLLMIFLLSTATTAQTGDPVILVGGGNALTGSQVSIEKNTAWILSILESVKTNDDIHLLYTDGPDPAVDVFTVIEPQSTVDKLKLIFGKRDDLHSYSNSRFAGKADRSTAESVKQRIKKVLSQHSTNGDVLFIYQGHGGFSKKDTNQNTLKLWQKTRLPANELSEIISRSNNGNRFRFLFTQCYSGSFARIIYNGMNPNRGLTNDTRCGFVCQLEFLASEGCTPSVNEVGYRDYSTYFFEALSRKTRTGNTLAENPDYNGDGRVSLREAHLYTLRNAYSVDYSMSTSEVYLENWNKWFTRWLPVKADSINTYYQIAVKIAVRQGLNKSVIDSKSSRHDLLKRKRQRFEQVSTTLKENRKKYKTLKSRLAKKLKSQWTILADNEAFIEKSKLQVIKDQVENIIDQSDFMEQRFIIHHQVETVTDLRREIAQIIKIDRMLELARSQILFDQLASPTEKTEYKRLVTCEETFL